MDYSITGKAFEDALSILTIPFKKLDEEKTQHALIRCYQGMEGLDPTTLSGLGQSKMVTLVSYMERSSLRVVKGGECGYTTIRVLGYFERREVFDIIVFFFEYFNYEVQGLQDPNKSYWEQKKSRESVDDDTLTITDTEIVETSMTPEQVFLRASKLVDSLEHIYDGMNILKALRLCMKCTEYPMLLYPRAERAYHRINRCIYDLGLRYREIDQSILNEVDRLPDERKYAIAEDIRIIYGCLVAQRVTRANDSPIKPKPT